MWISNQSSKTENKTLIKEWEITYPNRKAIIFRSLQNISPSHMLDRNIYNFHKS